MRKPVLILVGLALIVSATQGWILRPVRADTFQVFKALADPTATSPEYFGWSVALSGDNVLVGAPYKSTVGTYNGGAYLVNGSTGKIALTLQKPNPTSYEFFGISVAATANYVFVGAYGVNSYSGAVYMFDASSGSLVRAFQKLSPTSNDYFGYSLGVFGNQLLVSAPWDDTGGYDSGSAYLFNITSGTLIRALRLPTPISQGYFGISVSLSGDRALIGAPYESGYSGSAYLFNTSSGALIQGWQNPTPASNDYFGWSVGIAGNNILVGAPYDDTGAPDAGIVYIFNGTSGSLIDAVQRSTPANDWFGYSIAVDGNYAMIGGPVTGTYGAAYLVNVQTGDLIQLIANPSGSPATRFGWSVGFINDIAVVGSPYDSTKGSQAGEIYLFQVITPSSGITTNVTSGVVPLAVRFETQAVGGIPPFSYHWDFGDGASSESQNASHTYTAPGRYSVALTARDSGDHVTTSSTTITVSPPALSMAISANPTTGRVPLTTSFSVEISGGWAPLTYFWSFGDGATSTETNPQHTYDVEGTYLVRGIVRDAASQERESNLTVSVISLPQLIVALVANPTLGGVPLNVSFTAIASGGLPPYSYIWAFGDGGSSSEDRPNHLYAVPGSYSAQLVVGDSFGHVMSGSQTITVQARSASPLSAVLTLTPGEGTLPLAVQFFANPASGTPPYSYYWSFGDGFLSNDQNPTHTYRSPGTFGVVLEVNDSAWSSVVEVAKVEVLPPPIIAHLSVTTGKSDHSLEVTFRATVVGGSGVYNYQWNLGDDNLTSEVRPVHVYSLPGTYTVTLTVQDSWGALTSISVPFALVGPLRLDLGSDAVSGGAPLPVRFSASSSGGIAPYTYRWQFGDGGSSVETSPSHLFVEPGVYSITVTVTDAVGSTQRKTIEIAVSAQPSYSPQYEFLASMPRIVLYLTNLSLLAILVAVFFIFRRSKRRPPSA